jgi:hypothetical protein
MHVYRYKQGKPSKNMISDKNTVAGTGNNGVRLYSVVPGTRRASPALWVTEVEWAQND